METRGVFAAAGAILLLLFASASAPAAFPGDNGPIVFDSFNGSGSQVYLVQPNGSGLKQLAAVPGEGGSAYRPAIGPGSEKVAYTRDDVSSPGPGLSRTQIHLVNPDGTGDVRLTSGAASSDMASFSPDGEKIVYSEPGVGADAIATINVDGTGRTQLLGDTFGRNRPEAGGAGQHAESALLPGLLT